MNVLTVPNWSFGRERNLLRQVVDRLEEHVGAVHYAQADIDHNRTVTAFSGEPEEVEKTLLDLARLILPSINLQRHSGCHPRIGGLDVCPFIPVSRDFNAETLTGWIESIAKKFAEEFDVPTFLYEKSERGTHASDLPTLRKGGFGGLLARELSPDFGPNQAHPYLGATVMGWRDFLIAFNINFQSEDLESVQRIAQKIRALRREKDPRYIGVRALGFALPSQGLVQVSMNVTQPDKTPLDPIIESVTFMAEKYGLHNGYVQLIGVIRDVDVEHSVLVPFRPEQVIVTRQGVNP